MDTKDIEDAFFYKILIVYFLDINGQLIMKQIMRNGKTI